MGDPNSLGGSAYQVGAVSSVPMPLSRGRPNPLANDTPSQIPEAVQPKPEKLTQPEPKEGVALRGKKTPLRTRVRPVAASPRKPLLEETAVTSSTGAQAASPLFAPAPGSGGVGVGTGAPFGQRFGGYAAIIRDKVARSWRTEDVDPRVKTAPEVVVTFEILRDGTARNVRVDQRSGILTLDNSAQRAILNAAPFPPLPAGFDRDAAQIEFRFQLKR